MRFAAADAYSNGFDGDNWRPYGMPDAVRSDDGFGRMVQDPLEAHGREVSMAGDALASYAEVLNAREDAESAEKMAKMLKPKSSSGGGGGFMGALSTGLGVATKVAPLLAGLCDMRLKEDISPMFTTGQVNDELAAMALSVHHLRDVCS